MFAINRHICPSAIHMRLGDRALPYVRSTSTGTINNNKNFNIRTSRTKNSLWVARKRFYATAADDTNTNKDSPKKDLDPKILKLLHSYPKSANASPYEVLNISSSDKHKIEAKKLKKIFFKLAKIYHPDSSHAHGYPISSTFYTPNAVILNQEIKDERFKKILSAYNLLKNPITKANYDKYNIGWNDSTNLRTNPNMYNPSSPQYRNNFNGGQFYKSNFTSYETGTWEDRYRYGHETAYGFYNDKNWSSSKTGDLREEFTKNKKTIFLSILLTFSIYGALQLSHIYLFDDPIGATYNTSTSAEHVGVHERSENDLFHAYTNYGLGDTKQDRINRFLWWRKLTMAFSLADIKEVLENFHKRGIIDGTTEDQSKLIQYEYRKH